MTDVSPSGVEFICRTSGGAGAIRPAAITGSAPYWIRMTRVGSLFTASASADGTNWTQVGTQTVTMGTSVYLGLPVCSHVAGTLSTATFDHISLSSGSNPPAIISSTTVSSTSGASFNYQISATNSPTSFNAAGLPAALTINTSSGAITGTPTVTGTFPLLITATGANGTTTVTLTLTLSPSSLAAIDTPTLPPWGLARPRSAVARRRPKSPCAPHRAEFQPLRELTRLSRHFFAQRARHSNRVCFNRCSLHVLLVSLLGPC